LRECELKGTILKLNSETVVTLDFRPANNAPTNYSIKDWPSEQRPREKLLTQGVQSLNDAELLAVFLRTGIAGRNALTLGNDLLQRFGNLHGIVNASKEDFCQTKGLGLAKWANLAAAAEITRRSLQNELQERSAFRSPAMVKDYLCLWFSNRPFEAFVALFLDAQHRLIDAKELFRGTVNQTAVYPREVVKVALAMNAAAVVVSHNHPSGSLEPSNSDHLLTKGIKDALSTVDIRLLDHLIVGGNKTLSFAEKGLL
jgi:DNA repair protein RadC